MLLSLFLVQNITINKLVLFVEVIVYIYIYI